MTKVSEGSNLEDVIIKYLEYCEIERNLSPNTIKMYHFYLTDFVDWLKNEKKIASVIISDIDTDLVKKYRLNLNRRVSSKSHEEFKRSTQKTFLVALRAFLKYLLVEEDLEVMAPEQIILGKESDRIPKVFNEDQMQRFFEVQDLNKKSGV